MSCSSYELKSILIAGSGNIGRRHFESLLNYEGQLRICLLDPSKQALEQAKGIPVVEDSAKSITYVTKTGQLDSHYDLVIVATNSDSRLSVLEELANRCSFPNLLLEKFLFQSPKDFTEAARILRQNKINAWVNCSRRKWGFYGSLKKKLKGQGAIDMQIFGNNWGLACNGIHFLDLFAWLNDVEQISFNTDRLDNKVYEAKRKGYVEFFGTLEGSAKESRIQLTCLDNDDKEMQMTLKTNRTSVTINEKKGWVIFSGDGSDDTSRFNYFNVPKTSEITKLIVEDILNRYSCSLPSYDESAKLHLALLDSLIAKVNDFEGTDQRFSLPIT